MILRRNDALALAAVERGNARTFPSEAKLRANRVRVLAIVGDRDPLKDDVDKLGLASGSPVEHADVNTDSKR